MRPAVAVDHRLGDLRLQRQQALDARRRHHVAARILDEVLLAVGDLDVAVGIDQADVAGVQPAVLDRRGGCRLVVPVAGHHQLAAHQDLAVLGDADLDVGERRADRVELGAVGAVARDDRRRLGLAVALQQAHAERREEHGDLVVERRAAGDERLEPAAEARRAPSSAPAGRGACRAAGRRSSSTAAPRSACGRAPPSS